MSKEDRNEVEKLLTKLSSYLVKGLHETDKVTVTRADANRLMDLRLFGSMREQSEEPGHIIYTAQSLSDAVQCARRRIVERVHQRLLE